jgi:hypothetical protein
MVAATAICAQVSVLLLCHVRQVAKTRASVSLTPVTVNGLLQVDALVRLLPAVALDVRCTRLAHGATMLALRYWSSLLVDVLEGSICACGSSVSKGSYRLRQGDFARMQRVKPPMAADPIDFSDLQDRWWVMFLHMVPPKLLGWNRAKRSTGQSLGVCDAKRTGSDQGLDAANITHPNAGSC